jgi:hypothetical protein
MLVGIFYGHWVHFTVFCYILWTFGIVRGNLVHFFRFGILYQEKSGNPALPHFKKLPSVTWSQICIDLKRLRFSEAVGALDRAL